MSLDLQPAAWFERPSREFGPLPGMPHCCARLFPVGEAAQRHIDAAIAALKEGMA